jgi:hypothetical protein
MIATAIGKPIANAPKIAKVNSPSKLTPGRTSFTDMLHSTKSEAKKPSPGRSSDVSSLRTVCPEGKKRMMLGDG